MPKKIYISIFILIILVVASLAAFFAFQTPPSQAQTVASGLKPGDTFTYSMKGISSIGESNATTPENFLEVNMTDYYRVTITTVSNPIVSFNTTWRFTNGTQIDRTGQVNIETGADSQEFWAIYAANLTAKAPVRQAFPNGAIVNETETRTYKDDSRQTNILQMQGQFYDSNNPTRTYSDFMYVHFDSQTGILVELKDMKIYSDPQIILTFEWKLVDSNVWTIT
jgi:hypothetical protein